MNSAYLELFKNLITVAIAVLGWIVGHYFTSRRDRLTKKRDISLQYQINAYRVLTDDISHRPQVEERIRKLESVITDIQLFGSARQISLVKKLATDVVEVGEFELDSLINDLRDDLRREIGLSKVSSNVKWLRWHFHKKLEQSSITEFDGHQGEVL
jgi:hypothetical protein